MNGIDQIVDEAIKIACFNKDILELIKNNTKNFFIDDLFEITKIFINKKNPNIMQNFEIEDFKKEDPNGYFQKILKGFCSALIDLSQNEITLEDKNIIEKIISDRKRGLKVDK